MVFYLARRVLQAIMVVLVVSALVFFVSHLAGDPAAMMAPPGATAEQVAEIRHAYGLDRPVIVQYLEYMNRVLHGDMGTSMRHGVPVVSLIRTTLPNTIQLALAAQLLAIVLAIPAGMFAATHRNSVFDTATMTGAVLGQSMPGFWLGLMLMLVFGVKLRWLPISGMGGLKHLVLPAVTLSVYSIARTSRLMRSSMLEVLGQEYVTTARAKGLPEWVVLWQHALKNAFVPILTILGLEFGMLLGGAVIVETVFAWPGMGRLLVDSIFNRDFPLTQALVIFISVVLVVVNLGVDIMYTVLDPRIKFTGGARGG
jgi:peptide/nickel transport system permease protein